MPFSRKYIGTIISLYGTNEAAFDRLFPRAKVMPALEPTMQNHSVFEIVFMRDVRPKVIRLTCEHLTRVLVGLFSIRLT